MNERMNEWVEYNITKKETHKENP